ncbi:hypothetical protein H1R20_g6290, partial [Candolleomyces eurysporus]
MSATNSNAQSAAQSIDAHNLSFAPKPPTFTSKAEEREWLKFRLAQSFRIFGHLGYNEGVAGHITVRDPIRPDCFWVNPFGLHFSLIQPSDLLLVDPKDESGPRRLLNTAAYMIHSAIHAARPDVICAAHTHSMHGKAFSSLGVPLDMLNQDSCAFYDDIVVYSQFNGIVLDEEEGNHIAQALGSKKVRCSCSLEHQSLSIRVGSTGTYNSDSQAAILQNHGLLVATNTIEATVFFYIALERACQAQLLADAAAGGRGGRPVRIPNEEALKTSKTNGNMTAGWFQGLPEFQFLEAREGVTFALNKGKDAKGEMKPSN